MYQTHIMRLIIKRATRKIKSITDNVIILSIFLSYAFLSFSAGIEKKIIFQQFSLNEGLSQSSVFYITQDKKGYMWFATGDGLNRYDGYKFTIYRHNKTDSASLINNNIRSLAIDSKNRLWIGTQSGLSMYNKDKEVFVNYPWKNIGFKKQLIYNICESSDDQFLLATDRGLVSFSEKGGYQHTSFPTRRVSAILKLKNKILVGSDNGLFYYDPENDTFEIVYDGLRNKPIMAILPHNRNHNKIWIGTEGEGLYLYDLAYHILIPYTHRPDDNESISSNYIRSLSYDNQQRLWVGTFVGLNILKGDGKGFYHLFNTEYEADELSQNSIRAIYADSQGGMWCGTYFGGLNYYHNLKNQFEHLKYIRYANSLNDNVVSTMLAESSLIWIGTNDNGLNVYNTVTDHFSYYKHKENDPESLSGNNIKALLRLSNGNMAIGSHDGGLCILQKNNRFKRINISSDQTANSNVYSLFQDENNILWVGTLNGLFLYDFKSESGQSVSTLIKTKVLDDKQIMTLYSDSKKRLWIGTDNGLYIYDKTQNQLYNAEPQKINDKQICCIVEDKQHSIWIGSQSGLFTYDEQNKKLFDIGNYYKIPDYRIYGILEDSFNRLWMSSNSGLICLNKESKSWRIYTEPDGIQSNQFNMYAYCKSSDGKMYFGGTNGITAFFPERLIDNPYTPAAIIDNLTVFNKKILPGDESKILEKSIDETNSITLKSSQSLFGLEFVVPNYLSGGNNLFSYTLEGFDTDWYNTTKNSVSYSNLNPGNYTFKVKVANNDGKWSSQTTELHITVLPHWWETWWAKLIFALLVCIVVFYGIHFYTSRKIMRKELALERKEKERTEELSQMKIRFFINISHEFRTPLTLILSPIHEILERGVSDKWLKNQLLLIQRNSKRMLHLINQVLDYRRAEMGAMELHVQEHEIKPFVQELFDMFARAASNKKIDYNLEYNIEKDKIFYDENYLERILTNLISNALKYTPEFGNITVKAKEDKGSLIISVSDTGCGIPKDKQDRIFERFYQVEENSVGTGIGLSFVKRLIEQHHGEIHLNSTLGEGSEFTVIIPCEAKAYSEEERSDGQTITKAPNTKYIDPNIEEYSEKETAISYQSENEAQDKSTLLLVEDDADVRKYLYENFSQSYHILQAENGEIAWDILNKGEKIDFIISDVMMPVMDGIKFCKLVKQNIHFCHIPLILLTAKSTVGEQLTGLNTGADDYISKPFVFSVLRAKVQNILKGRQRAIRNYAANIEANPAQIASNGIDEELLNKAIGIIEKNLENPNFSAEEFSREMGMSRSNLHLKLKALTGESAVEFIRRIRFGHACRLLKEGKYNVSEISTMVGFTPSYFTTSFKKYRGCLPSEYVKNSKI